jgi:hypothetical protein
MKSKSKLMHLCMIVSISGVLNSSDMESVLEVGRDNQALSAKSQERIDTTERQTDKIINEWKAVSKQVEGLKLYNEQKRLQIKAQQELLVKLRQQTDQVEEMQIQIPGVALGMLNDLEDFVVDDIPFRHEERLTRLSLVRESFSKPKITPSENVRQVLEAYNIEAEYGRKIDTYEATVEGKLVNILIIGRIGKFYQTKDEQLTKRFDTKTKTWEELPGSYRRPIRDGIRIAKKLAPTDMLMIPVVKGELKTNEGEV